MLLGITTQVPELQAQILEAKRQEFTHSLWVLSGICVLFSGVTMGLAWLYGRRLQRPIVNLIRSAREIGEGDYTKPLEVTRKDEIADLQEALDDMRRK